MDFNQLKPDDPRLNWGVVHLEILQKLWQQRGLTGKSSRIGFLDSGDIPQHPDLLLAETNKTSFTDKTALTPAHGAWSAGLALAAGKTVFGVAPEAKLTYAKIALKTTSVAEGIEWMLAAHPAVHIISIGAGLLKSNATPEAFQQLETAVNKALKKGKIIVAPIGNEASAGADIADRYPASFPGVLAMGALTKSMTTLHPESGINGHVCLVAPGEGLLTAEQGGGVNHDFGKTSAATAFAAGCAAVVLQALRKKRKKMKPADFVALLQETAAFPFASHTKCQSHHFGCGIINPVAAVEKIESLV
jgi:hypothetical protein